MKMVQSSREIKQILNSYRKREAKLYNKKNGAYGVIDDPEMERKHSKSKKNYSRKNIYIDSMNGDNDI